MRTYKVRTYPREQVLYMALILERLGHVYRKDYDARDAPSYFLDNRPCSFLYFGNKQTYGMLPYLLKEWEEKSRKDARNAKRRKAYAEKRNQLKGT